ERRTDTIRGRHQGEAGPDPGRATAQDRSPRSCRGRSGAALLSSDLGLLLLVRTALFTKHPAGTCAQMPCFAGLGATRRAVHKTNDFRITLAAPRAGIPTRRTQLTLARRSVLEAKERCVSSILVFQNRTSGTEVEQLRFLRDKNATEFEADDNTQAAYYLNFTEVVAGDGIEPPTQGFSVLCSTD